MRDQASPLERNGKVKGSDDMDSDDETSNIDDKLNDADDDEIHNNMLSPEDAKKQGEIAEGVRKIKACTRLVVDILAPTDSIYSSSANTP